MILERISGGRFSRVLPAWRGETVAILGGGPSLTLEQFEAVHQAHRDGKLRAIAINDSYLRAPWADVHYAADAKWHKWHEAGIDKPLLGLRADQVRERWASFQGQKCSIQHAMGVVTDPAIHFLRNQTFPDHATGISTNPESLFTGRHGGFQCVNISTLAGASDILLLGFDAKPGHWHGDHPSPSRPDVYPEMRRAFSDAQGEIEALGVRIINCSMMSAIETFPKARLEEALAA